MVGSISAGNSLSTQANHTTQGRTPQNSNRLTEENRYDDTIAFNLREPDAFEAQEQCLGIGDWLAIEREHAAESTPGYAEKISVPVAEFDSLEGGGLIIIGKLPREIVDNSALPRGPLC